MSRIVFGQFDTRFGPAVATIDERGRLIRLDFDVEVQLGRALELGGARDDRAVRFVADQVDAYGRGRRRQFDLPLEPRGTPFQRAVWNELIRIPYGSTRTYGELAARMGKPGAARAVGRANATNPIALVIPCHRVIGSDGGLTGYAGGIELKRAMLELEGARFAR